MIWYFAIGVTYVVIRFRSQKVQDTIVKLKEEFIIPKIVLWFILLVSVVLWPVALLFDLLQPHDPS